MNYDCSYFLSDSSNGIRFIQVTHKSLGKEIKTFLNSRLLRLLAKYLIGYSD